MILTILEWGGAILLGIGVWKFGSKKASDPKKRLHAFVICNIGSVMLFAMTFIIGLFGIMMVQVAGILNNMRGIYNTLKEIKQNKKTLKK